VQVILKDPDRDSRQSPLPGGVEKHFLTLTGRDTPGIVAQISGRLARERIDITDLYGVRRDQSFVMILELEVPIGVNILALRTDLEKLGAPIGLSATLQHENSFTSIDDPRQPRISAVKRLP
jgi:predicted amino acid-binding ACT domain protein